MQYTFYLVNESSGTTWKKISLCSPVCRSFCAWPQGDWLTYVSASNNLYHSFARDRKTFAKQLSQNLSFHFVNTTSALQPADQPTSFFGKVILCCKMASYLPFPCPVNKREKKKKSRAMQLDCFIFSHLFLKISSFFSNVQPQSWCHLSAINIDKEREVNVYIYIQPQSEESLWLLPLFPREKSS